MFDLQLIKSKYRNVRFDLIGILFLIIGFIILYNGIVNFYGFYNYLGFITDIFGKNQGGKINSHDTEENKTMGLYLIIIGVIVMGLGILGIYIQKKK